MKKDKPKKIRPKQSQSKPGLQSKMRPEPQVKKPNYHPAGKLAGKVALITGGDSGIGQAVAVHFSKEGADIAIIFRTSKSDANETKKLIEQEGRKCLLIQGDIGDEAFCKKSIEKTIKEYGHLEVLVNNAAEQHPQESILDISAKQLEKTFRTNIFSMFYLTKAALSHLKENASIINTASVTAYRGSHHLIDYSATKGAIIAFTRSLALSLADEKIRVNAVAPGPIWTPLIPSTFPPDKVAKFGSDVPMKRAGEPSEVAPSFVFLASDDSSYFTGQVLHPNGGEIVNA